MSRTILVLNALMMVMCFVMFAAARDGTQERGQRSDEAMMQSLVRRVSNLAQGRPVALQAEATVSDERAYAVPGLPTEQCVRLIRYLSGFSELDGLDANQAEAVVAAAVLANENMRVAALRVFEDTVDGRATRAAAADAVKVARELIADQLLRGGVDHALVERLTNCIVASVG